MKNAFDIHPDLIEIQKLVYEPAGLVFKNLVKDTESQDYAACTFALDKKIIKFRVAKITPTKIGQFVTFYKRSSSGPIEPYDLSDQFDLLVVSVRDGEKFGQFVFPKNVLYEKDILSKDGVGGKRAMRVYPPWDIVDNLQAKKTQAWQLKYFFEVSTNGTNIGRIKTLLL